MGKHSEWRKLVKKLRRKLIRQQVAKERDERARIAQLVREQTPGYKQWLENEEKAEDFRLQEEQRIHDEQEAKWKETERIAQVQWAELQEKIAQLRQERARQNAKIKEEWEREQKKLKDLEELKKKEVEEKARQQELLQSEIDDFIANGGEIPEQLNVKFQSNPGKTVCPFFSKTAACRFGDGCSRNHVRPGISRIIQIPNFYSHYSLSKSENEHGSSTLEFENSEVHEHFREFFFDVVPEMEKCGRIRKFFVCCNSEVHLRGNVYVEYTSEREAVKSHKIFNGRWYAGKQLNVHFCEIPPWGAAICGLFDKQRCPKGSACNFIHIFFNPRNLYNGYNDRTQSPPSRKGSQSQRSSRRDWRWSESPEHEDRHTVEWEDRTENSSELDKNRSIKHNHQSRSSKSDNSSSRSKTSSSRSKRSSESSRRHQRSHSRSPSHKSRRKEDGKERHTSKHKSSEDIEVRIESPTNSKRRKRKR